MAPKRENLKMLAKLIVVGAGMFSFGYLMVPVYYKICEVTGINNLSRQQGQVPGNARAGDAARRLVKNTQIDYDRTIAVQFDANTTGPWHFKPAQNEVNVHPGELATVMYTFENSQDRRMTAQAVPSYAPRNAGAHFHKIECFCFNQYTLDPGEAKEWPVTFVVDPKLRKDVKTITLSYTFFEVGGRTPPAPAGGGSASLKTTPGRG